VSDDKIEKLETPSESTIAAGKTSSKKKVKGSNRIARWFREMRSELKKVVWPTPKQIANNTLVSLTVMTVSAIAIWLLDLAAGQIFEALRTFVPRLFTGW